ncbi:MAG TPA: hypothetical protein VGJ60_16545 [Chloroflexota bacterium]
MNDQNLKLTETRYDADLAREQEAACLAPTHGHCDHGVMYAGTRWCSHPLLRPTEWEQKKPAPARFNGCEHTYSCPVCGMGQGMSPDPCNSASKPTRVVLRW